MVSWLLALILHGAEVLFYPTAIGWHPGEKRTIWCKSIWRLMNVMKGHAVQMVFMWSLQTGIGLEKYSSPDTDGIEFKVPLYCRTAGEILAQASHDKEEILIAEVDLDLQENVRQTG
jgi:N-carbamoylputrescine amidase